MSLWSCEESKARLSAGREVGLKLRTILVAWIGGEIQGRGPKLRHRVTTQTIGGVFSSFICRRNFFTGRYVALRAAAALG